MSLANRAADLYYSYRFIKLLTTPWEETEAFKLKLIDVNGKRDKTQRLDTEEKKNAYTTFHRLVYNVKRIISDLPFGKSKTASYAASLYLLKEKFNLSEKSLKKILEESNLEVVDLLNEKTEWYLLEDKRLSPGIYKVNTDKLLSSTLDEMVKTKDKIRISDNAYPIDSIFGIDIYEAIHINTNQVIHIALGEIYK